MKKTIQIVKAEAIKSGVKNGRNWTLYRVVDQDGEEYTTFSNFFVKNIGKEVEIEFTEEERVGPSGKTYIRRKIVDRKKSDEINEKLDKINEKLDEIYQVVDFIREKFEN